MSEAVIVGSAGDDTLIAAEDGSRLIGGAGDDVFISGDSDDTMIGAVGDDTVVYDYALDYATLTYNLRNWEYTINLDGGTNNKTLSSTDGTETDTFIGIEKIVFLNSDEKDVNNVYDSFTYHIGQNNQVMMGRDKLTLTEDISYKTIDVTQNDHDLDGDRFGVTSITFEDASGELKTIYGGGGTTSDGGDFNFNSNSISYRPPEEANKMAEGESYNIVLIYTVSDAKGLESSSSLTITVEGTNDVPVITYQITSAVMGLDGSIEVDLMQNVIDIDNNDDVDISNLTITSSNSFGAVDFLINEETGLLNIDRDQFRDLSEGEAETLNVKYQVLDSYGGYTWTSFNLNVDSVHTVSTPLVDAYAGALRPEGDTFSLFQLGEGVGVNGISSTNLSNGQVLITFGMLDTVNSYTQLFAKIFTSTGDVVGELFPITPVVPYDTVLTYVNNPQVTSLSGGGFVVAYHTTDADRGGVAFQIYDDLANAVGDQIFPYLDESNIQYEPTITSFEDGGFLVSWTDGGINDSEKSDVYAQRFDALGNPVDTSNEFLINTITHWSQYDSDVVSTSDGGFVAVWVSIDSTWRIKVQLFDQYTQKLGTEIVITDSASEIRWLPDMVVLENGNIAVTWTEHDTDTDGSDANIYVRVLGSDGVALGPQQLTHTDIGSRQDSGELVALSDGGFIVAWTSGIKLLGQKYDQIGRSIGENFIIGDSVSSQGLHDLVALDDGGFLVTWLDPTDQELKTQLFRESLDENSSIGLNISASISDVDGSESLTYLIEGIPEGASLSNGYQDNDGGWVLTEGDLDSLIFTPAEGFTGRIDLYVTVTATESANDQTASTTETITLIYDAVDDVIQGTNSADVLVGGAGNDDLSGLLGNDEIIGGKGNDTLSGGGGADLFIYNQGDTGVDVITDFNISEGDKLDLSDLLFDAVESGEYLQSIIDVSLSGSDTLIDIDANQDGSVDQSIQLQNVDLVTGFNSIAEIIDNLLNSNNLDVI